MLPRHRRVGHREDDTTRALTASLVLAVTLIPGGSLSLAQQKAKLNQPEDRAAIAQAWQRFVDSWNRHDPHANAILYTEDADVTNVLGMLIHGRANIEAASVQTYAGVFKDSHLTGRIRCVRFLTPELASVDVDWEMTGVVLNGTPVPYRKGLMDWVMAKQGDGSWLIEIFHNTELTNTPGAGK